jgi:hypothetical protein
LGLQHATDCRGAQQQLQLQQGVVTRRRAAAAAAASAAAAAAAAASRDDGSLISLAALTALTSLKIHCTVPIACSLTRWFTNQLRGLTLLHSLHFGSWCRTGINWLEDHPPQDNAALGEALAHLVLLTDLQISAEVDGRAIAAVRNLPQLQVLGLSELGSDEHPVRLQDFPSSLVHLWLNEVVLDCTVDASWQLPALEQLGVAERDSTGFKLDVTTRMPQLLWLDLTVNPNRCEWGLSNVLDVLPKLQHLWEVKLHGMQYWPEVAAANDAAAQAAAAVDIVGVVAGAAAAHAAEAAAAANCAALTVNSQMTALRLEDCWIPAGVLRHFFPASMRLRFLQVLSIDASHDSLERTFQDKIEHQEVIRRASLLVNPGDIALLVECCPDLRELSTLWVDDSVDGKLVLGELQCLLSLQQLTRLGVGGLAWGNEAAESLLAELTGGQAPGLTVGELHA